MNEKEMVVRDKQEATREEPTRPGRAYQPEVDIYETAEGLWLWADMPGADEKQVSIELVDGVLSIEAPVAVGDYGDLRPVYTEYRIGNYMRRFAVSSDVDPERIQARMLNGVLELQLPKAERARPRRIEVRNA
jgi:HSP20 family protein